MRPTIYIRVKNLFRMNQSSGFRTRGSRDTTRRREYKFIGNVIFIFIVVHDEYTVSAIAKRSRKGKGCGWRVAKAKYRSAFGI